MARNLVFAEGEFYHVYNRGSDKRDVFLDKYDLERFLKSIQAFNTVEPVGSLYRLSFKEDEGPLSSQLRGPTSQLVEVVCYCLNPNHYHLLLKQVSEDGISKFMQRLGTGYTLYFNEKNKRSGVLFQGKFKAKHINNDEYLLHLSAYINLNFEIHEKWQDDEKKKELTRSSWNEYCEISNEQICKKGIILDQFSNPESYKFFALNSMQNIKENRGNTVPSAYFLE